MKKKTRAAFFLAGMVLSLAFGIAGNALTKDHVIQAAAYTMYQDGYLYGVDITQEEYYLFRIDTETGYSRKIREPRIQGGQAVTVRDLVVLPGGQAYFYWEKSGEEAMIRQVDFDREDVSDAWELSSITEDAYWAMEAVDGKAFLNVVDRSDLCTQWILDSDTKKWEKDQTNQIKNEFDEFFFSEKGLWALDAPGDIYLSRDGGEPELFLKNDGSEIGPSNCYYRVKDGNLHFYNVESGKNYALEEEGDGFELRECPGGPDVAASLKQFGYVTDVRDMGDGLSTGYAWMDEISVPFLQGEELLAYTSLLRSPGDQLWVVAILSVLALAAYSGVILLLYGIYRFNHGKFPLFIQMLVLCVPLFFAIYHMTSITMERILLDRLMSMEKENLIESAYQSRQGSDKKILQTEYRPDLDWDAITASAKPLRVSGYYDMEKNTMEEESMVTDTIYYTYRDGNFYDLTMNANKTVPFRYTHGENMWRAMDKAVKSNAPVTLIHQDINGNWLSVFLAYRDETGSPRAIIEMRKDIQGSLRQIAVSIGQITREILMWLAVLMSSVVFLLAIGLFPITRISRAVEAISRGRLDTRVRAGWGFTELGQISRVFNEMVENIGMSIRELSEIGKRYSLFVPPQFFTYLGKKDILETERGDYAEQEFLVMQVGSCDFESIALDITGEEAFESMKVSLDALVPILEEKGGMVAGFKNSGTLMVYQEGYGDALGAAVRAVAFMNGERFKAGKKILTYTAGISFGPVRLGLIGAGHRTEAAAMSLNCHFASLLQRLAVKYGAGILITGEAAKRTEHFEEEYHYRILGYAYFRSKDVVDVIYDVYDCEDGDTRRKKEETRAAFEEGVRLFMGGEFLEARNCFIHVLYKNRDDRAARQYFYRCETCLEEQSIPEKWQYVEVF